MKRTLFSLIILTFLTIPLFSQSNSTLKSIETYLDTIGEGKALAEIFLVNIEGNKTFTPIESLEQITQNPKDRETPLVSGGILFFSYNLSENAEEIISFTDHIHSFCSKNETNIPYIAIDQEGGEVNRLRNITSYLPSPQRISEKLSPKQAYLLYQNQAEQMKSVGFTMNLAPVFEAASSHNKDFLSLRSYGSPAKAAAYSLAAVTAYEKNGIGATLKHFPGNTNADPHSLLPEIALTENELYREVMLPLALILQANPSAVLMSHARTKAIDSSRPACLSREWTEEMLRKKLSYKNLVVSDDLFMAALAKNGFPPEKACVEAILAGTDVIMLSEKRFASVARILLEKSKQNPALKKRLREAETHVIEFKLSKGILKITEDGKIIPAEMKEKSQRFSEYKSSYSEGVKLYKQLFSN